MENYWNGLHGQGKYSKEIASGDWAIFKELIRIN